MSYGGEEYEFEWPDDGGGGDDGWGDDGNDEDGEANPRV